MPRLRGHNAPVRRHTGRHLRKPRKKYTPVRSIEDGGTGIPVPLYHMTYRGETLRVFGVGKAREALDFLAERGRGWACISIINGVPREVARNR